MHSDIRCRWRGVWGLLAAEAASLSHGVYKAVSVAICMRLLQLHLQHSAQAAQQLRASANGQAVTRNVYGAEKAAQQVVLAMSGKGFVAMEASSTKKPPAQSTYGT